MELLNTHACGARIDIAGCAAACVAAGRSTFASCSLQRAGARALAFGWSGLREMQSVARTFAPSSVIDGF